MVTSDDAASIWKTVLPCAAACRYACSGKSAGGRPAAGGSCEIGGAHAESSTAARTAISPARRIPVGKGRPDRLTSPPGAARSVGGRFILIGTSRQRASALDLIGERRELAHDAPQEGDLLEASQQEPPRTDAAHVIEAHAERDGCEHIAA